MLINKRQRYLLGLVLATTLSANVQSANAQIFNGNQYEPNTLLIPLHNPHPTVILPNYDGGLFQNIDTMPVGMEEVVADFSVSKYDKTPPTANKFSMTSHHQPEMIVSNHIPEESQPNEVQHSLERNRRYAANSQYLKGGTLVSTNYNTVSMQRTMEDLQNIGYLGMNDVSAEPLSEGLTRELKETTYVAFAPDNSCDNFVDHKLLAACQNKNVEKKVAAMPMIHDKTWSAQMTKDFSFWQSMNISVQKASK
ncbi:hypothetical protein LC593_13135 [Nostoc sp. CHAB 5844]|nr:hypothetical protein [Nostoc sp. CHAB 5844]